ncbi:hypothetical protein D3C85_819550 [compost metagenome]
MPNSFVTAIARDPGKSGVDIDDAAVGCGDHDAFAGVREHAGRQLEFFFGLFALGDITQKHEHLPPGRVAIGAADLDWPPGSVLAAMDRLELPVTGFDQRERLLHCGSSALLHFQVDEVHLEEFFTGVTRLLAVRRIYIEKIATHIHPQKTVEGCIQNALQRLVALLQCIFCVLARAEVTQNDAQRRGTIFVCGSARLQMRPQQSATVSGHAQLAGLWFTRGDQLPTQLVENVLIVAKDEARERLLDQFGANHFQQMSSGKVGLEDRALHAERQIAYRGQIIEIEIALLGLFELGLRLAQLLILHLQFDLVHAQFMQRLLHRFWRHELQVLARLLCIIANDFFGHLAQPHPGVCRGDDALRWSTLVFHWQPLFTPQMWIRPCW